MKIRSLASLAIACFALLMPRLVTSEGAFGGAIAAAKPACDSKNINHACSGPSACRPIVSVEETTNVALKFYVPSETVNDCDSQSVPGAYTCVGKANAQDDHCDH